MNAKEFLILNRPEQGLEIHIGVDVTDYRTDWHFHEEWQVVQVLSGARVFEWRSGSHVVSAGQTLVIPPGCVHRGEGGRASFRKAHRRRCRSRRSPIRAAPSRRMSSCGSAG